uniref:Uncharacterized protein n=1 Tax=Clandestinovirus TaxID=2831644 RepID=A0A8F8KQR4_9VIRU|nr:hypothetical protein KOM_12_185 [Clandestinovirus]
MKQSYLDTICFDVYYHRIFPKIEEDDINVLADAYNSARKTIKEYRRLQTISYGVSRFDVLKKLRRLTVPNLVKYLKDISLRHSAILPLVLGVDAIPHFIVTDIDNKRIPEDAVHYKDTNIYSSPLLSNVNVFLIGGGSNVNWVKVKLVRKLCTLLGIPNEDIWVVTCRRICEPLSDLRHATWSNSLPYERINSYYEMINKPNCNAVITDDTMARPWTHNTFLKMHIQWKATKGPNAKYFYIYDDVKTFNVHHHGEIFENMLRSEDVMYAKLTIMDEHWSIMTHSTSLY